jgi:hypothetical protein
MSKTFLIRSWKFGWATKLRCGFQNWTSKFEQPNSLVSHLAPCV